MVKPSRSDRRRLHQAGIGGRSHVVRILPRSLTRGFPRAPELTDAVRFRLQCVTCAQRFGVAHAVTVFAVARATVYRLLARYDPHDLRSLASRSRRPHHVRRATGTAEQEQAVLALRRRFPRYGKDKLRHLLAQQHIHLSTSMIGRLLASLRRRNLLREPHGVRVRRPQPRRPHAVRAPKAARTPTRPGQVIPLDTVHLQPLPGVQRRQFSAIDVVSRCAVFGVRSTATAHTAAAFLEEVVARMPVAVEAIQIDGGAEFMADFAWACQRRGIALYVLPPRSPKLNGRVERINGTSRREFWECYDGELDLPTLTRALRDWETLYNTERPHQALGDQTPRQHLTQLLSHMS